MTPSHGGVPKERLNPPSSQWSKHHLNQARHSENCILNYTVLQCQIYVRFFYDELIPWFSNDIVGHTTHERNFCYGPSRAKRADISCFQLMDPGNLTADDLSLCLICPGTEVISPFSSSTNMKLVTNSMQCVSFIMFWTYIYNTYRNETTLTLFSLNILFSFIRGVLILRYSPHLLEPSMISFNTLFCQHTQNHAILSVGHTVFHNTDGSRFI